MFEIVPYRPAHRSALIELWNETFAGRRHFRRLDRESFQRTIERVPPPDGGDPRFFPLAVRGGTEVIGFAHGGVWEAPVVAQLYPARAAGPLGYLSMIAVAEAVQRTGVGTALLGALREAVASHTGGAGAPLVADGRMYNPHYGNFLAPRAPLWGTTEGPAVPAEDEAARGFFQARGFREHAIAWSFVVQPGRAEGLPPPAAPVEIVVEGNYLPELLTLGGAAFPAENASRTWVAVVDDVQVAYLVAYPLDDAGGASSSWGIYTLEVSPAYRGRRLGSALLSAALDDLGREGVGTVETLVLPLESAAALRLYQSAGFEKEAGWIIFQ